MKNHHPNQDYIPQLRGTEYKSYSAWAVFGPEGHIREGTISFESALSATKKFEQPFQWKEWLDKGYSVHRISIQPTA